MTVGDRDRHHVIVRADAGQRLIKTHYFLPGFYQKRGFGIDQRWGGLVRFLEPPEAAAALAPA